MTVRPMEASDVLILQALYNEQELSFDVSGLQSSYVVVDEQDKPFLLCGVKMVPELVMICDQKPHVTVRLKAIALMHETLREKFPKGAFAFVSPKFGSGFIATMVKRFKWQETWKAFRVT